MKFSRIQLIFALFLLSIIPLISCIAPTQSVKPNLESPINVAILGLLQTSDDAITIVPAVTKVSTTYSSEEFKEAGGNIDEWKMNAAQKLYIETAANLRTTFKDFEKFKLVSLYEVQENSPDIQLSNHMSASDRKLLKENFGLTHLLLVEVLRTADLKNKLQQPLDNYTYELYDVATGDILASQLIAH